MLLSTLIFWRDNLTGVISMTVMAIGDGIADLVGRRFGKSNKWFFSADKSIAGTAAFVVSSFLAIVGLSLWLDFTGAIPLMMPLIAFIPRVAFICIASSLVELLPFGDDNWNVPIAAAALSMLLLQ